MSGLGTPNRWQHMALFCWLALIVLGLGWELWWAPLRPQGSMLALKILPLLLPLRGILQCRLYTMQWASMLVLLYLAEGVVRTMGDHGLAQLLAGLEILLALGAFAGLLGYLQAYKKRARQLQGK